MKKLVLFFFTVMSLCSSAQEQAYLLIKDNDGTYNMFSQGELTLEELLNTERIVMDAGIGKVTLFNIGYFDTMGNKSLDPIIGDTIPKIIKSYWEKNLTPKKTIFFNKIKYKDSNGIEQDASYIEVKIK